MVKRLGTFLCYWLHGGHRSMENYRGHYCNVCHKRRDSRLKTANSGYMDRLETASR